MAGTETHIGFDDVQTTVGSWSKIASVKSPTNQMTRIKRLVVASNGVSGEAEALKMRLTRIVKDSGTASAVVAQKTNDGLTVTPQVAGRHTFTANPTEDGTSPYLAQDKFHPQGGVSHVFEFDNLFVKEGKELMLEVFTPTGGSAVKLSGHFACEE